MGYSLINIRKHRERNLVTGGFHERAPALTPFFDPVISIAGALEARGLGCRPSDISNFRFAFVHDIIW
jgi:hypothetical protein